MARADRPGLTVRVWWAGPTDAVDATVLDDVERDRAAGFRYDADRGRFVVGAVLARHVLGRHLAVAPAEVPVDRSCATCGRPHGPVRSPGSRLRLSVSHAGTAVVVAAALDTSVGIDVEPVAGLADARPLARDHLAPTERAVLAGLDDRAFTHRFAELWVAKEAVLKATGDGLRLPMAGLELAGPGPSYRLRAWGERPDLVGRVSLRPLRGAPPGHVASLAVLDGPATFVVEELSAAGFLDA